MAREHRAIRLSGAEVQWDGMSFASSTQSYNLPPPEPTPPAVFSVPQKGGGYAYYQSPPGVAPGLGDNWPNPSIAHPNPVGVASTTIGRSLPPGSVLIGHGKEARGSITPLPGAGGAIPGLDASLGSLDMSEGSRALSVVALGVGAFLAARYLLGGHRVLYRPRTADRPGVPAL